MVLVLLLVLLAPSPTPAGSLKTPKVDHPIVAAHVYTKHLRCDNCGMKLNMWARTRHAFTISAGAHQVCSIHCVAEMARQKRETPQNVKVALYLEPETMVAAEQAAYVVGSTAAGTMTAVSEIAFASKEAAQNFASEYGGTVMSFTEALAKADAEL
jgi:nitrous oxide reductase accessory protein NosL